MAELLQTLIQIGELVGRLLGELVVLSLRWSPLIVWVAWWLWGANWRKLGPALAQGAWAPVVLLTLMISLIWSALTPSSLNVGGAVLPNYLWQFLAVTGLLLTAGFCGWLQTRYAWQPAEIDLDAAPVHHGHNGHDHH